MSEVIRWALVLVFMASLWGMSAFLIYKQAPGWGWFLACVTIVMLSTSVSIKGSNDPSKSGNAETDSIDMK